MVTLRFSKLILMLFLGLLSQAWARDMPDDRSLAFPSNTTIPASTFANQTPGSSWYGGIGSGIGNALSSGLSGAGYYLGKLVPSSVTNFFNDLGKSAMAKGISAYNYIASLAPESPVLEGGALQAAEDGLIALKDQATDLLEQAIQLNQRLTAYAGVSERYQRPAAIGLLVGETVATIAALYYSIGLIKAALAAGANKSLTKAGAETVADNANNVLDKLNTILKTASASKLSENDRAIDVLDFLSSDTKKIAQAIENYYSSIGKPSYLDWLGSPTRLKIYNKTYKGSLERFPEYLEYLIKLTGKELLPIKMRPSDFGISSELIDALSKETPVFDYD